ncbi:unannotated protein [freshwater metagenome]|uniref:Unannotated protein n=1 Tax=freshwater metagenome TaxID=449393 RepID=A0A6J7KS85_9ZZZZ
MTGRWNDFVRDVQSRGQDRLDDVWLDGYEQGAEICLGVVAKAIAELQGTPGSLPKDDQAVLLRLRELRIDMTDALAAPPSDPPRERDGRPSRS